MKLNTKTIKRAVLLLSLVYLYSSKIEVRADWDEFITDNGYMFEVGYEVPPPENVLYNISQAQITKKYQLFNLVEMDEADLKAHFKLNKLEFNECGKQLCSGSDCEEWEYYDPLDTSKGKYNSHSHRYCTSSSWNWVDKDITLSIQGRLVGESNVFAHSGNLYKQRMPKVNYTRDIDGDEKEVEIDFKDYSFITYRGLDTVTISKYSLSKQNKPESSVNDLKELIGANIDYKDTHSRYNGLSYNKAFIFHITEGNYTWSDYDTSIKRDCGHGGNKTDTAYLTDTRQYNINLRIGKFTPSTKIAIATPPDTNITTSNIRGKNLLGVSGTWIQNTKNIKFVPWVRMYYEEFKDSESVDINVKTVDVNCEKIRELVTTGYAEVGYTKSNNININLKSNQWSTHERATSVKGVNNVLPGGATYQLDTDGIETLVYATTWQFFIPDGNNKNAIESISGDLSEYSLVNAEVEHSNFKDTVMASFDNLTLNLVVNDTVTIEAGQSGIDISNLRNGSTSSSTDSKYILGLPSNENKANEFDLDVQEKVTTSTYYKIYSKVDGTVWMDSNTNLNTLINNDGGTKLLNQNQNISALTNTKALAIDKRTKIISNYLNSIQRNAGYDATDGVTWVNGCRWYNEAFEIYLVEQTSIIKVGIMKPTARTAVLDPKLIPKLENKSDQLKKFYKAKFKTSNKGLNGQTGVVGGFRGQNIIMTDLSEMFQSKEFYIPNITVQDTIGN